MAGTKEWGNDGRRINRMMRGVGGKKTSACCNIRKTGTKDAEESVQHNATNFHLLQGIKRTQTDRQTDRQTDTYTHTHTHTQTHTYTHT